YVGYEFETKGFDVSFKGIIDGFEDLGRDLICKREKQTVIVQCKMWAHYKTVYEKHIFQFFGTVFQYKDEHPYEHVEAQFFTTTKLSELARKFSKALGITLREGHEFEKNYPCIKCNVSEVTGEKIYHLPFDQQYDKVKIRNPGEFYCRKVEEAEDSGFRRAFRYRGKQD
ncbi:MAG TPA: restriction endonuclease, partial [bacterium]|nr:restriction endonuclease [bacterium]